MTTVSSGADRSVQRICHHLYRHARTWSAYLNSVSDEVPEVANSRCSWKA